MAEQRAFISPQQLAQLEDRQPPGQIQGRFANNTEPSPPLSLSNSSKSHKRTTSFLSALRPSFKSSSTTSTVNSRASFDGASASVSGRGQRPTMMAGQQSQQRQTQQQWQQQQMSQQQQQQQRQPQQQWTQQQQQPQQPEQQQKPTNQLRKPSQQSQIAKSNEADPLHPEIRSVVSLQLAQSSKVYFSGQLIKRLERMPDGQRPAKDDGWIDVFAQLGGTTLSIWDMNAVNEAHRNGQEVPPSYINISDAFVQVLGSVTIPATSSSPPKKYLNVITLNTAGANLILFSCPDTNSLISWAAALRLSSWEKSRLEEIYTAHMIRLAFSEAGQWKEPPSKLVRGKFEGAIKVRVAGKTDWQPAWAVISARSGMSNGSALHEGRASSPGDSQVGDRNSSVSKRMSALFRSSSEQNMQMAPQPANITLYLSNKSKDRKKPFLTIRNVSQAFAVYPERPDLISRSALIKVEGLIGDEEAAGAMKSREGWIFMIPEMHDPTKDSTKEMTKWILALHDAFGLYGRDPKLPGYTWDPRDHISMMFAYPIGPNRDRLFLDRELAEPLDPRDDRTSAIRSRLTNILLDRLRTGAPAGAPSAQQQIGPSALREEIARQDEPAPTQQPQRQASSQDSDQPPTPPPRSPPRQQAILSPRNQTSSPDTSLPQMAFLPPLDFGASSPTEGPAASNSQIRQQGKSLSPITEKTTQDSERSNSAKSPLSGFDKQHTMTTMSAARSTGEGSGVLPPISSDSGATRSREKGGDEDPILMIGHSFSNSPVADNEPSQANSRQLSDVSQGSQRAYASFRNESPRAQPTTSQFGETHARQESSESIQKSAANGQPPESSASLNHLSPKLSPDRRQSPSGRSVSPGNYPPPKTPPITALPETPSSPKNDARLRRTPPPIQTVLTDAQLSGSDSSQPLRASETQNSRLSEASGSNEKEMVFDEFGMLRSHAPGPVASVAARNADSSIKTKAGISDQYHAPAEPKVVPMSAIAPTPQKRTGTPMVFDTQSTSYEQQGQGREPEREQQQELLRPQPAPVSPASAEPRSIGRRPSGARAPPAKRVVNDRQRVPLEEHDSVQSRMTEDANADYLAALSFVDQNEPPEPAPQTKSPTRTRAQRNMPSPPSMPTIEEPEFRGPSPQEADPTQYRSSFAPSKQVAERKARSRAAQAASQAAVQKPGRPANGGRDGKMRKDRGAWESSEEEEEEEEDEDDDDGSEGGRDVVPPNMYGSGLGPTDNGRPPRSLPQIPSSRSASGNHSAVSSGSGYDRDGAKQGYFDEEPRVRQPNAPHHHDRPQAEYAHQVPSGRTTVWSTVLDGDRNPNQPVPAQRDTFINLDEENHTMTKAFTPQGLLSAGLHDKQERSAKRQEEVARETGNSLVNVPSKPPPPQTGLLGAITGYERDRKREGGVGAALTERERERRLAEDRQRKLDDYQRQQLDQHQQMAQGGNTFSMYQGGQQPMSQYLNPMMANPMMMGGFGGYPMMGGFQNPQQMFAAQQAAQAYQQAMMSYSQAGSQVGDNGNGHTPQLSPGLMGPMSPNMGMSMMGAPQGFDPRMTMMNMGMMSPMGMGAWGDPRMSMFTPPPGMEMGGNMNMAGNPAMQQMNMQQMQMQMQNGGVTPQHTGMGESTSFAPPQPPGHATPPPRGSGQQTPNPT